VWLILKTLAAAAVAADEVRFGFGGQIGMAAELVVKGMGDE
jgi:hypothetical protein